MRRRWTDQGVCIQASAAAAIAEVTEQSTKLIREIAVTIAIVAFAAGAIIGGLLVWLTTT